MCTRSRFLADIDPQYLYVSQTSMKTDTMQIPQFKAPRPEPLRRSIFASSGSVSRTTTPAVSPAAESQTSVADADFTIHNAEELAVGMRIQHNRFGSGMITEVDSSLNSKIMADFGDVGVKTLLLKFAKFKILK